MIRRMIAVLCLSGFWGAAVAGSCPLLMNEIDAALADSATEQRVGEEQMQEARRLRDKGEEAHRAGDHAKSVEVLNRARAILGIS